MPKNKENQENVTRRGVVFRKRMKMKGYAWLCHWVPKEFKEKVKEFAKSLKEKV
jgi:hypothetical protein